MESKWERGINLNIRSNEKADEDVEEAVVHRLLKGRKVWRNDRKVVEREHDI